MTRLRIWCIWVFRGKVDRRDDISGLLLEWSRSIELMLCRLWHWCSLPRIFNHAAVIQSLVWALTHAAFAKDIPWILILSWLRRGLGLSSLIPRILKLLLCVWRTRYVLLRDVKRRVSLLA